VNTSAIPRTSRCRWSGAFLALGCIAAFPVLAQLGRQFSAQDFKYREPFETPGAKINITNRTRSLVVGAEGVYLTNNSVLLSGARLENYAPAGSFTNLVAVAPRCLLDLGRRVATSTGRIDLLALQRRLWVRGDEGFLFMLTNSSLVVSNRVRTYIHPEMLKSASP